MDRLNQLYLGRSGTPTKLRPESKRWKLPSGCRWKLPEVFDVEKESESRRDRYGDTDFGRGCLMARRLVERGVRMVQVYFGNSQPWDSHEDIRSHRGLARRRILRSPR